MDGNLILSYQILLHNYTLHFLLSVCIFYKKISQPENFPKHFQDTPARANRLYKRRPEVGGDQFRLHPLAKDARKGICYDLSPCNCCSRRLLILGDCSFGVVWSFFVWTKTKFFGKIIIKREV